MWIRSGRIRRLATHTGGIPQGRLVVPATPVDQVSPDVLARSGLSYPAQVGESVLPSVRGGSRSPSWVNAEGRDEKDRTERETYFQTRQWTHLQWRGSHPPEEVTEFVDIPRTRFKTVHIPALGERFTVSESPTDGRLWIATTGRDLTPENTVALTHQVNLLLEHFGMCALLDDTLETPQRVTRVDWEFLPPGEQPWEGGLPPQLRACIGGSPTTRPWHQHRLDRIGAHKPEFTAIGRGGMFGYVLFHFPEPGVHVLECARYGNATYVIPATFDWEAVTRMTKAELLRGDYVTSRLIHHSTKWDQAIDELVGPTPSADQ